MNQITRMSILLLALSTASGCERPGPRAFVDGQDSCEYCRMSISDFRFGAQFITTNGVIHTFDSIECLAGFVASLPRSADASAAYVTDFANAGSLIAAADAIYLVDSRIESPMGRRVAAFAPSANESELRDTYGGDVKSWSDVRQFIATDSTAQSATHHHAHEPLSAWNGGAL